MAPENLSVIITAHRAGLMLRECLQGVSRLSPSPGEVIVAVDGSCPEIRKEAVDRGFLVVELPDSPGVSATRNAGAFRAKGSLLAFLDSDVVPQPDFVTKAISALGTQSGTVAAFGSYDDNPGAAGLVSRYRNLLHHFTHQSGNSEASSFWAACGVCEASVFSAAGGFDESFRVPSVEDIAFGYRLRRLGHRIALDPSWQVKHLKKWRAGDLVMTDIVRRAIPWTLLLLDEGRLDNDLNIDHRARWSALLVSAGALALLASWNSPWWMAFSLFCLGCAVFLNQEFYLYLCKKEGLFFALRAIPLHLFYYLAALAGYVSGWAVFLVRRIRPSCSRQ